jgi:Uma2 family endonuclease
VDAPLRGHDVEGRTTLWDAPRDFREPDFIFWPASVPVRDLFPAQVQLLVEIGDSNLDYDLGPKACYYASLGLPGYWVIDARRLVTRIHREPARESWSAVTEHTVDPRLVPLRIPELAVWLRDLGLEPGSEDKPA